MGVSSEGETAKAKFVIGDPSYFPGKAKRVGQVVRALCILSHPIPNCGDAHSVQIILPQKQTGGGCPIVPPRVASSSSFLLRGSVSLAAS